MNGTAASVAVFGGVLALVGGLGWLLYSAGGPDDDAGSSAAARPLSPAERIIRTRPPPEVAPPEITRRPKLPSSPEAMAKFVFPGHEQVKQRDWKEIALAWKDYNADSLDLSLNGHPEPESPEMKRRAANLTRWDTLTSQMPIGIEKPEQVESKERPAFAANLVSAVLDAAKMPLTEDQVKRIYDIGLVRMKEVDAEAEASRDDDGVTYVVERIAERSEKIDRFFTGMWDILTPQQANFVSPPEYRYHCRVDPLCSGRMIEGVLFIRPFSDVEKLIDNVTDHLARQLELSERRDEMRPFVEAWARQHPLEDLDPLERRARPLYSCRRLIGDARRMGKLLRSVVDGMNLTDEPATKARQMPIAYVPIRQTP